MKSSHVEPWDDPDPLKPFSGETRESESADDAQPPVQSNGGRRGSRLRLKSVALGLAAGVLLSAVVWIVILVRMTRDGLPLMDAADFAAAKERWREHKAPSYDLDLAVHVMLEGKVHVEVRQGAVTAMTRNGMATPEFSWSYWSVDGLLTVIGEDVRANEKAIDENGGNALTAPIVQQAKFDPTIGIPLRYLRSQGTSAPAGWEITSFQPIDSK